MQRIMQVVVFNFHGSLESKKSIFWSYNPMIMGICVVVFSGWL